MTDITPETIAQMIAESQESLRTELKTDLTDLLNKTVSGATNRTQKELQNKLEATIQSQFAPILEAIAGSKATEQSAQTEQQTEQKNDQSGIVDGLNQFKAELESLKRKNESLQLELQKQRQETEAERIQRLQEEHLNRFVRDLNGKVTDPTSFADLLILQKNAQFDPQKGYVVPTVDEFQNPITKSITEFVDDFLKEKPYFAPPLPGNGTGSTATTTQKSEPPKLSGDALTSAALNSADPIAAIMQQITRS